MLNNLKESFIENVNETKDELLKDIDELVTLSQDSEDYKFYNQIDFIKLRVDDMQDLMRRQLFKDIDKLTDLFSKITDQNQKHNNTPIDGLYDDQEYKDMRETIEKE
jgi:hypothetical protein